MLGYDVEFGHRQAADLLAAPRYAEKQVGYLACSLLLSEQDEFLRLVTNSVRSDLVSRNEAFQALALTFLANVGGAEMASLLAPDAATILLDGGARPGIRGKAALALLRAARKSLAQDEDPLPADAWAPRLAALLDDEKDVGLLLCVSALVVGVVARSYAGFECLAPRLVSLLARLRARDVPPDCAYYGIACPWAQVKVLRALQYFPPPVSGPGSGGSAGADAPTRRAASAALKSAIDAAAAVWGPFSSSSSAPGQPAAPAQPPKNVNKSNALHAIALEAAPLALGGWGDGEAAAAAAALLAKCALGGSGGAGAGGIRDANVRCLGLDALARLGGLPVAASAAAAARPALAEALKDNDTSIRRRALDLLFSQADAAVPAPPVGGENGSTTTTATCGGVAAFEQLLSYLSPGGGCAPDMREEVALRAAVLAERFAPDSSWYARSLLALVEAAGEDAPPDVWRSAAHVVASADAGGRAAAASAAIAALRRRGGGGAGAGGSLGGGGGAPDPLACAAAFLVGEYGRLVVAETSAKEQFTLLRDCLAGAGRSAKGMLLTALLKVEIAAAAAAADPSSPSPSPSPLKDDLDLVLSRYASSADPDLQQRAVEYRGLASRPEVAARDVGPQLPPWEQRRSGLLRRMAAGGGSAAAVAASTSGAQPSSDSAFAAGAGVESDEVAVAPAWFAEDAAIASSASASAAGSAAATPVAAAAAAASAEGNGEDFFSVANGGGCGGGGAAPAAVARDPLEDLLSLDVPSDASASAASAPAPVPAAASSADPFAADPFAAAPPPAPPAAPVAVAAAAPLPAATTATPKAAAAPAVVSVVAPTPPPAAIRTTSSPSSSPAARIVAKEPDAAVAAARALKLSSSPSSSGPAPQSSGVLFEDPRVQVGVRCTFDPADATGTLALFVGNKSGTSAMGSLRLELPSSAHSSGVKVSFADPTAAAAAAFPSTVGPKQQVQLPLLRARCVGAYSAAPKAALVFSSPETAPQIETAIELLLPLAPTKFVSPPAAPLARDAFFARWRSLAAPPLRVALRVERNTPLPAEAVDAALRAVGLGVQPGLDPEPANAAAAGSFAHQDSNSASPSPSPASALVRVPVMTRVEVEASTRRQAQVTVACPEAALAGGLLGLLARLLKVE